MRKNMRSVWRFTLCCCLIWATMILTACAADVAGPPAPKPAANAAGMPLVPNFTLTNMQGEPVSLADYAGKQVVLYFWASWCPACKQGMPEKQALYNWMVENNFPGTVLAINLTDGAQETRATCDAYVSEEKLTFPVLYDEVGEVTNLFVQSAIPVTAIIDADGYLKSGMVGSMPIDQIKEVLERNP